MKIEKNKGAFGYLYQRKKKQKKHVDLLYTGHVVFSKKKEEFFAKKTRVFLQKKHIY